MLKITSDNYHYYKKLFTLLWQFLANKWGFDENKEISPTEVLDNWETQSMALAKNGLREGLRDILTMLSDISDEYRIQIDEILSKEGFQNLQQLTAVIREVPAKVLKRGKIKDPDEYFIIKELLANGDGSLSEPDMEKLIRIFENFERKLNGKNAN